MQSSNNTLHEKLFGILIYLIVAAKSMFRGKDAICVFSWFYNLGNSIFTAGQPVEFWRRICNINWQK